MTYREVARRLRALGCEELHRRGSGSHRKWHNPPTGRVASVPDWGSKDLKRGTIRAVVSQLGLSWVDFGRG
jgi:mRNA interferase HicA